MANKSNKVRTQELLKEYLKQGKPIKIRNKIIELNYRFICWVAKHYKTDGYCELDDLIQEGVLAVINTLENTINEKNAQFFNKRLVRDCCYYMDIYRRKMMCSYSGETYLLWCETQAFWNYIRKNSDEWSDNSLETFIRQQYFEDYNSELTVTPSYFQEKVQADDIPVEDDAFNFEIVDTKSVAHNIYNIARLTERQELVMDAYLFNDLHYRGKGRATAEMFFSDLAWQGEVCIQTVIARFNDAKKKLRKNIKEYLKAQGKSWVDDVLYLCDNNLQIKNEPIYIYDTEEPTETNND